MSKKEILSRIDLVELASRKTSLVEVGSGRYRGLSPFSNERTPSFFVCRSGIWYCFSTGQGGGIVDYVRLSEGLTEEEAWAFLAREAGLENPQNKNDKYNLLCAALEYFRLYKKSAQEYTTQRGLPESIIDKYELGFAPKYGLVDFLFKRGFSVDEMIEVGLVRLMDDGSLVEVYRNRVIIPIRDHNNLLVSFIGRDVSGEARAKYLHGIGVSKSKVLWGLPHAAPRARAEERVLVCEGPFDAIALLEAGFPAVAILGSSISTWQLSAISRICANVYALLDGDQAGSTGMAKISQQISESGGDVVVYAVRLPDEASDPDEYLRKFGKEALTNLLLNALPDTEHLVKFLLKKHYSPALSRTSLVKRVLADARNYVRSRLDFRSLDFIERLAHELALDTRLLSKWMQTPSPATDYVPAARGGVLDPIIPAPIYERRIMYACLLEPRRLAFLREKGINLSDFTSQFVFRVLSALSPELTSAEAFSELSCKLPEKDYQTVCSFVLTGGPINEADFAAACEVFFRHRFASKRNTNFLGRPKEV